MTTTERSTLALLGGTPLFPGGLPLTRVQVPDMPGVLRRVEAILESGQLTNGAVVRELEERAAEYLRVPHVVATASCTAGLMLVLRALCGGPIPAPRARVLMPSFSFSATAHAAAWVGAEPVFADIEAQRLTVDPVDVSHKLDDVAVLMGTHVYGNPCAVDELAQLADARGIPVLYDAAHALGSRHGDVPIGGFGVAEVFSLSPTKVAVAGEGGLVATRDSGLADELRMTRNYGNPGNYDCAVAGLNARMSELHAAVALASLADLEARIARRAELVAAFVAEIAGVPGVRSVLPADGDRSTFKDLTLVVDADRCGLDAGDLAAALSWEGVDTRHYFHPAMHRQQVYARNLPAPDLPVTEALAPAVITVPLWSHMETSVVVSLARLIAEIMASAAKVEQALSAGSVRA